MRSIGITMPSRTASLERPPEDARLADEAGFNSVCSYQVDRNPFATLNTSALTTSAAWLGAGLAAAFSRSPFECANAIADADELCGRRALLGARRSSGRRSGIPARRYRCSWDYLATMRSTRCEGTAYTSAGRGRRGACAAVGFRPTREG
jgi:alkanesulfonate monooxygenase SsuD/methylene tetrahydromethanopterin reductase-like flavin-dependent oxidoreductase (luciferase family)